MVIILFGLLLLNAYTMFGNSNTNRRRMPGKRVAPEEIQALRMAFENVNQKLGSADPALQGEIQKIASGYRESYFEMMNRYFQVPEFVSETQMKELEKIKQDQFERCDKTNAEVEKDIQTVSDPEIQQEIREGYAKVTKYEQELIHKLDNIMNIAMFAESVQLLPKASNAFYQKNQETIDTQGKGIIKTIKDSIDAMEDEKKVQSNGLVTADLGTVPGFLQLFNLLKSNDVQIQWNQTMRQLEEDVKAKGIDFFLQYAPPKDLPRSFVKVMTNYKGDARKLTDCCRSTFFFDNLKSLYKVLDFIHNEKGFTITKCKHRLSEKDSLARDVLINVSIPMKNGKQVIGEIQFDYAGFKEFKQLNRLFYKVNRIFNHKKFNDETKKEETVNDLDTWLKKLEPGKEFRNFASSYHVLQKVVYPEKYYKKQTLKEMYKELNPNPDAFGDRWLPVGISGDW